MNEIEKRENVKIYNSEKLEKTKMNKEKQKHK